MIPDKHAQEIVDEMIEERWSSLGRELSAWEEMESRVENGDPPEQAAADIASQVGPLEGEVDDSDLRVSEEEVAQALLAHLHKRSEGDSYMPTDDVSTPLNPGTETDMADPYAISRMQTQGAAKERALAEGFTPDGRKLRLFEIAERRAVHGDTIRWEIRDCDGGEVVDAGGPLFLDAPQHNDAALAEARGQAYAAIRDACEKNYRDLRAQVGEGDQDHHLPQGRRLLAGAALRPGGDLKMSKKAELLHEQIKGLHLSASMRRVVADIEAVIEDMSEDFIRSFGMIAKQDWDPGSSWEVVEADGVPKIVRRETKLDDDAPMGKHSFHEGQTLRVDSGIVPEDVVVRGLLGDRRYSVQSLLTNSVFQVDERDLYSAEEDGRLFEGGDFPIDAGEIAKLF